MKEIEITKVTVNIGVGESGDKLERAKKLLTKLTGKTPVQTLSRERNPTFNITKGKPIGTKVTLRGPEKIEFLKKALDVKDFKLSPRCFDKNGNFAFGVSEYIDLPGIRYDTTIGMYGFDVAVTLERPGYRIAKRRRAKAKIGNKHRITKDEGMEFAKKELGITVEE